MNAIPVFQQLSVLPGWMKKVLAYCAAPDVTHSRAADWLLDNDYQIFRAIRQVHSDLPLPFYQQLFVPDESSVDHVPRVFTIAQELLDIREASLTLSHVVDFIDTYQSTSALSIAELWALPSMLRLACLERLVHAVHQLNPLLTVPFAVSCYVCIDDNPTDRIARAISHLAAIQSIPWSDFVDQASVVERLLEQDPAGVYKNMTFETRDRYRQVVEKLARQSVNTETQVAEHVIELAVAHTTSPEDTQHARLNHIGYWLVDEGRLTLETHLGCKPSFSERSRRFIQCHATLFFFTALVVFTALALLPPGLYLAVNGSGVPGWIGVMVMSLPLALIISVSVVYWLVTKVLSPHELAAMDFQKGIPEACKTAVVIPVIISCEEEIEPLIERLEIRQLSNPDPELRYVLLSDFADASSESIASDEPMACALIAAIRQLNQRSQASGHEPFYLIHRQRRFNLSENCWMGWERKRGKLEQFNDYLVTGKIGDFSLIEGAIDTLRDTRFVITLDADTTLPRDTAAKLIGTLAHPLNSAVFHPDNGRVIAGYTVLQPRIEALPVSRSDSLFSHIYAGDNAIDIYSRAVSDVYQDLFGSGIFVGKGIYEVKSFRHSLAQRVPENALLSHDLFEGIHGRAALVTGIVLYESFPTTYPEFATRLHRWIRGDWQLLPWLGRVVRTANATGAVNRLSALDRWKIIDNLRRSLLAPGLLAFILGGWLLFPGSAWVWTLLALLAPAAFFTSQLLFDLLQGMSHGRLNDLIHRFNEHGGRWFLSIVFLLNDTLICVDAILRTLWRMLISKQYRLAWKTAAHSQATMAATGQRDSTWRMMWPASVTAALIAIVLAIMAPLSLLPATPLLLLWLMAPEVSLWIGKPRTVRRETLDPVQIAYLQSIARRTWHFFETYAGPDDHWLPPDNVQHEPTELIAHRTSPTNVGLYLVSAVSANDFGYVTTSDLSMRVQNTLETLNTMQRYRGHFLNWYDTGSLEPLTPRYVSTVDSGNLAVALLTLQQSCLESASGPLIGVRIWHGLATTVELLFDATAALSIEPGNEYLNARSSVRSFILAAQSSPSQWHTLLIELREHHWHTLEIGIAQLIDNCESCAALQVNEVHVWLERCNHQLRSFDRELVSLVPWQLACAKVPEGCQELANDINHLLSPDISAVTIDKRAVESHLIIDKALEKYAQVCNDDPGQSSEDARKCCWLQTLRDAVTDGSSQQQGLMQSLLDSATMAVRLSLAMDFKLTYDTQARLFHIGYNVDSARLDEHHYDLLATEARLASFFAIAKNDAPLEHWFHLGRPITRLERMPSLLSWNGSMFEYLMPPLFLPSRRDTLLGQSESTAVDYQIRYAKKRKIPWGISESSFAVTDADGIHQYRAFGAPGLGIRRGLTEDLVIAPYATALALCTRPKTAVENLRRLQSLGAVDVYGFIEALDFTPERIPPSQEFLPVKTHMAHHHGMTIAAIANALDDDVHVRRTMANKRLRAVELLLQEGIPWSVETEKGRVDEQWTPQAQLRNAPVLHPWFPAEAVNVPQLHMLGNGRLSSWVTAAGSGTLAWQGNALTRWVADSAREADGYWIYVSEPDKKRSWSISRQPVAESSELQNEENRVVFHQHMVEFDQRTDELAIRMEVTVPPGHDADIRRITVKNESNEARTLEFTSYAEVLLCPALDDERHPSFSKLFVNSEFIEDQQGLLFTRRPRRPEHKAPVLLHKMVATDEGISLSGYESDRARFIGRNGNLQQPVALQSELSRTVGYTLDPAMALRIRVHLEPLSTKSFAFLTAAGASRQKALDQVAHIDMNTIEYAFTEALRYVSHEVDQLALDPMALPALQTLSSLLIFPHPSLRDIVTDNASTGFGQSDLWRFGVSGDVPILLLRMQDESPSTLLETLARSQRLWQSNGLTMDIVVLRNGSAGYDEPLRERVLSILRDANAYGYLGRSGGIHLLSADTMDQRTRQGIAALAQIVIDDDDKTLEAKLSRLLDQRLPVPLFEPVTDVVYAPAKAIAQEPDLLFANDYGGFDPSNGDYLIHLEAGQHTPAPWSNVLANTDFGSIVTESGLGFTWGGNSGEHRLTPASTDPVIDSPVEVIYLRDEVTADIWTITPAPLGHDAVCEIRHGAGFTQWTQNSHDLEQEQRVFVAVDDPVKIVQLRLRNKSLLPRRITATYYADWVLGALRSQSKPRVVCHYDNVHQALLATSHWNADFADHTAFLTASISPHSISGDRVDFFGPHGTLRSPQGLRHWDLGGVVTPGAESCAAYQVHVEIAPESEVELFFVLGDACNPQQLVDLLSRCRTSNFASSALTKLHHYWEQKLNAVQVKTPDIAFDLMTNRWLQYQVYSSRLMARAGFYQPSGAFGFRDQLQDCLALLYTDPTWVKGHLLEAASHQFEQGDAQHWWHPPSNRGVRTHISDDYLWLVYVTARYVKSTGDKNILTHSVPFLKADPLRTDEHDRYAQFDTGTVASLYEHCTRALDHMLSTGEHGLPLIGTGDWNDGMDRVGVAGKGESIWLAWFQIAVVRLFDNVLDTAEHKKSMQRWKHHTDQLEQALNSVAWDGEWYIRAFDDKGEPWGSSKNDNCRIDSIAQSWSVLSGLDVGERSRIALQSAADHLIYEKDRLVLLQHPPFHSTTRDPGYIKAYPPGIRENGGQYTHAAAWLGLAFAGIGNGDMAWHIFDIINPIRRTTDTAAAQHYEREPYVICADVYGPGSNLGKGGWSWYTGAASWSWQLAVEAILGLHVIGDSIQIDPCIPKNWGWAEFTMIRNGGSILVKITDPENVGSGIATINVDGAKQSTNVVKFPASGEQCVIEVHLGSAILDSGKDYDNQIQARTENT